MTIPATLPVAPTEVMGSFEIGETDDMLDRMMELFVRHGDTYRVIAPSRSAPLLMIHAAEDVRRVLATNRGNYVKGLGFDRVRILLGDGLITSDGELWARQRAMMQPMFHRRVMAHFASSIAASNDALLARWEASADQGLTRQRHREHEHDDARHRAALHLRSRPGAAGGGDRLESLRAPWHRIRRATCASPTASVP